MPKFPLNTLIHVVRNGPPINTTKELRSRKPRKKNVVKVPHKLRTQKPSQRVCVDKEKDSSIPIDDETMDIKEGEFSIGESHNSRSSPKGNKKSDSNRNNTSRSSNFERISRSNGSSKTISSRSNRSSSLRTSNLETSGSKKEVANLAIKKVVVITLLREWRIK